MDSSGIDTHEPTCWICQLSVIISASIVFLYILCFNTVCRYYIRAAALYLTIVINSVIVCSFWPLYFITDFSKFIFDSFRVLSAWTGVQCELRNGAILKEKGPYVIISNHQARAVFVDRYNRERARQSLEECAKIIHQKKLSVWVFPEGTRNHGDGMLEFKKGAFNIAVHAQIPIVPVVISSYKPFYCKNSHYFYSNGFVIAEVMKPISTTGMTWEDVPSLTDRVRGEMVTVFEKISKEAAAEYYERCSEAKDAKNDVTVGKKGD